MSVTIETCRALVDEIKRRGGPAPNDRVRFARACAELDMIERQAAAAGLGAGPFLAMVLPGLARVLIATLAGMSVLFVGSTGKLGEKAVDAIDLLAKVAVVVAAAYGAVYVYKYARA